MTVNKFIRNLLNLKELAVTHFELDNRHRILNLWVKPYKNGCRCPECNRRCRIVNESERNVYK